MTRPVPDRFAAFLPTHEETELLQICWGPHGLANAAWQKQQAGLNGKGPAAFDRRTGSSLWKLRVPLLFALRRHQLEADPTLLTFLKAAYAAETARRDFCYGICRETIAELRPVTDRVVVLKGVSLAEAAYEDPALRHCHDLDLLLAEQAVVPAADRLRGCGFRPTPGRWAASAAHLELTHPSGFPVVLHARPFDPPWFAVDVNGFRQRACPLPALGEGAYAPAPADALCHVCAHAAYSGGRQALGWVGDAAAILARHLELDWNRLTQLALDSGLQRTVRTALAFLARALAAPVPDSCLPALADTAEPTPLRKALAHYGMQGSLRGKMGALLRVPGGLRSRRFILGSVGLPSADYLRWRYPRAWQRCRPACRAMHLLCCIGHRLRTSRCGWRRS